VPRFPQPTIVLPDPAAALASPARLDALARTDALGASDTDAFDRLTRLAARLLDAPMAMATLVLPDRQLFVSSVGLPPGYAEREESTLTHSVCRHVVAAGAPLAVADLRRHPQLREALAVRDLGAIAYAGVPLVAPDGQTLGTFCTLDVRPREWTAAELETLEDLAALTMTRIEIRHEQAGRERAESALREAERRFSGLVDQSLTGIYVIQDGRFSYVNRKFAEIFGYTVDETLALPSFLDVVVPEDRDRLLGRVQRRIEGAELEASTPFRGVRRDGSIVEVEAHGGTAEFEGRPAAVGVLIDVTARLEAQRRSAAVAAEHAAVLEAMRDLIFVIDADGRHLKVASGAHDRLVAPPDDVVGRTLHDLFPAALADRLLALVRRALAEGHLEETEYTLRIGERDRWFAASISPLDADRVVWVARDITLRREAEEALRQSEARLRALVTATAQIVWSTDADGRALVPSKAWRAFTGQRDEEMLGLGWLETVHPDDRDELRSAWERAMASRTVLEAQYRLRRQDGAWRSMAVRGVPLLGEGGEVREWIGTATDVTERAEADAALRQSEARYRSLVAASAQIVWSSGPNGEYSQSDWEAWGAFTGQERREDGAGWLEAIHPDDRAHAVGAWQQALAEQRPYEVEYRLRRHDGEWRHVLLRGVPMRGPGGAITEWIGTITDVTERVRTEAAIRESEAEWRALLGTLDEVILVLDADGRYLKVAPSAVGKLYRPPEELVGRRMHEVLPAPQADRLLACIRRALAEGRLEEVEYALEIEGQELWFHASVAPLDASRVVWMARDVTEQRRAEAALRESERRLSVALEGSNDGLWDWDLATDSVYYSPRWWRMLGFEPDEMAPTPDTWRSLVHPDELSAVVGRLYAHVEGRTQAYEAEYRIRHRDGRWLWILDRGKAVERDEHGRALRMAGTHTDVTERHLLEEQLRQAQKMEAVGQLAGGVAHDFNNLLAAIKINCALLDGTVAEGAGVEEVEEIRRAANRASLLTRQLLTFGRRQPMQPQVVDLNRVIAESELLLERLPGAGITIDYALEPDLPPVWADPGPLAQVLLNLALNARDAMPDGGAVVVSTASETVSAGSPAAAGLAAGRWVRLTVADSGHGMDAATQRRIFEPFFTTKSPGRGTGLGLSVVYGIVEQSGGRIFVRSAPGEGTVMSVYLPAYDGPAQPADVAGETEPRVRGGSETILLVEDEAAVRNSLRRLLQRYGYTVLEARHGADALRLFDESGEAVDLVLTDLVMPELGGWPLVEELRRRRPTLPVILMSGYDAEAVARELPPNCVFVGKPFTIPTILREVRGMLDRVERSEK
jgi:PAS domain S-box-containing protein